MKRLIPWILIFVFAFSNISIAYAAKSVSQLKKEQDELKNKTNSTKQNLEETKQEKSKVLQEVEKLDKQLNEVQDELDRLTNELEKTKNDLNQSEKDLDVAIQKKENQYKTLKKRMRAMYENGSMGYLQVILESEGFSDMLKSVEYINRLMVYDQNILDEYEENEKLINSKVEDIKEQKSNIETLTTQQTNKKHALDESIQVKEDLVKKLSKDEAAYLQQLNDLEKADNEIADLIVKEQKKAAEAAAAAKRAAEAAKKSSISKSSTSSASKASASSSSYSYSGGKMAYPVPAYTGYKPNSPYGYRSSPISGKQEFHTGVDLKATMGTNIVAAEDGVVIYSGTKGGYGKTIIIDHGNGVSTLYAHNSQLVAKVGQSVKRGETVSKAGTTGYSTGVHLHFEVRINGKHTDPMPYLRG